MLAAEHRTAKHTAWQCCPVPALLLLLKPTKDTYQGIK